LFAHVSQDVQAIFHSFEFMVTGEVWTRWPAAGFGLAEADGASFDNFRRREPAIEGSRAAPGEASLAQKDGAFYLTLDAV
jgi:hypothetical protein